MSSGAILAIVIAAVVVAAGAFLVSTLRRSDRNAATGLLARETMARDRAARKARRKAQTPDTERVLSGRAAEKAIVLAHQGGEVATVAAASAPAIARPAMDAEQLGVTRRQFLNRSNTLMMIAGISGFGASTLAFLYPKLGGGFGSKITVGKVEDILAEIETLKGPKYVAEGRTYLVPYPKEALPKAKEKYKGAVLDGMEAGVVALYQKCVHLGCRVPWCGNSQWFECPCHGSQYNRVGEKKGGPAPRGLDRFSVFVNNGVVTIDTAAISVGPPIGTNTTGQEAEGPHCVGGGE